MRDLFHLDSNSVPRPQECVDPSILHTAGSRWLRDCLSVSVRPHSVTSHVARSQPSGLARDVSQTVKAGASWVRLLLLSTATAGRSSAGSEGASGVCRS